LVQQTAEEFTLKSGVAAVAAVVVGSMLEPTEVLEALQKVTGFLLQLEDCLSRQVLVASVDRVRTVLKQALRVVLAGI
jgi:hypothetical protein